MVVMLVTTYLMFVFLFSNMAFSQKTCAPRQFSGASSIACVCNSTYCDEFPSLPPQLTSNNVAVYTTSQSGKRFSLNLVNVSSSSSDPNAIKITIDPSKTYQSIIGFGGAFTGAAGYNIYNLRDKTAQDNLINSYFGIEGIGYTLARVPIAASDFSVSYYSYDDTPDDFNLINFALKEEDIKYKIPYIQQALNLTKNRLKLFATPWSAPGWMKVDGSMTGGSPIKGNLSASGNQYFKAFANYHIKFFEKYMNEYNISFWGVTIQNEPNAEKWYPSMSFSGSDQRDFVKTLFGPMIRNNSVTKDLKIMIWDSSRDSSRDFIDTVLSDYIAASYVDGIGIHWYGVQGSDVLDNIHQDYPDKWLLYTESSASFTRSIEQPQMPIGNWEDGYHYARDIIDDLNHWSRGWTDWNMCLNATGEPRFNARVYTNTTYTAPIIVSSDGTEFYKQPEYYVLGHFSKLITPNSTRIFMNLEQNKYSDVQGVSFLTPDNQIVTVFYAANGNHTISLQLAGTDRFINLELEANSITTLVWKPFPSQCPSEWYRGSSHPNKCYKFLTDKQEPWFEAQYDCSNLGLSASLVSIDDAFENSEITAHNLANSTCNQFFIGLLKGNNNQWAWSNNDSNSYRNWKNGYPTNDPSQICGTLDKTSGGQWMNQNCDTPQCYICQMMLE